MEEFAETYGWYELLLDLAQGDISKMDEVSELNLYVVYNYLTYKMQKADVVKKMNLKNQNNN